MLYLDHTASTPLREVALETLKKSYEEDFANPSAEHNIGFNCQLKIMAARASFLQKTQAFGKYDFFFTGSATESNNSVFFQFYKCDQYKLINPSEHPSMLKPLEQNACKKTFMHLPLSNTGKIEMHRLEEAKIKRASLISFCLVNNQNGFVQDYLSIAKKVKSINPNIHLHLDAVQAFTKIPINMNPDLIDSISIAAHKMGGPKGIAGLYWNKKKNFKALLCGGGHENSYRSSTQNTSLILSFQAAFEEAILQQEIEYSQVSKLKGYLQNRLLGLFPQSLFPFEKDNCSPYILLAIIPEINSQKAILNLSKKKIYVGSSSACAAKKGKSNPVFKALNIPENYTESILRISLHPSQSFEDLDHFTNALLEECQTFENLATDNKI